MKNKTIAIFVLPAILAACATEPKEDFKQDVSKENSKAKVEAAQEIKSKDSASTSLIEKATDSSSRTSVSEKPKTIQSVEHAALTEAIRAQSDDKIYTESIHVLASSPHDIKALNALAMYHYKKGRYDLSRFLLGKALAAHPKSAEIYSNLGVIQLAQKETKDAVKSFRKALEIDLDDPVAASNLGAIYTREKDWAKANVVLEIAYKKGMRDPRLLNNYAITLTAMAKYEKAEVFYKEILQENQPSATASLVSNKEILLNYAILLVERMGKYSEGLEVINRLKFVGGPGESRNKIIALENKAKAGLK